MEEINAIQTDFPAGETKYSLADKNFSERSESTQEIISRNYSFMERWALSICLAIVLLLIAGTWLIKYPVIIEARAVLTAENGPKEIIPRQSGKLISLLVNNGQKVQQGEIVGWIESNGSSNDVVKLSKQLDNCFHMIKQGSPPDISAFFNESYSNLGELQLPYQTFVTAWQQYNDYLVNGFYYKKKEMLHKGISTLRSIQKTTNQQKELNEKDNELAQKTLDMNEKLYKEKIISAEEYRQAQSIFVNKQLVLPQVDAGIYNEQNLIRDKENAITELEHDILQQKKIFEQALYTLKSNVDDWIKKYSIRAPSDGQIVFVLPIQQNKYVEQGKLLGYLVPPSSKYYAELILTQNNFGKIDTGMKVQLRFDAYPYQETGFVSGRLNYISTAAVDSGFLATVVLENGLTTNRNKNIRYKNGLKAQALIITKDVRLLQRLYYSIIKSASLNK